MEDSEEISLGFNYFQTRSFSQLQRFTIPVTAKRFCKFIFMAILPAAKPSAITPTPKEMLANVNKFENQLKPAEKKDHP
jgi:hypothetical protein